MGVSGDIQVRPIEAGHLDTLLELCREHAEYEQADFKDDGQIERWLSALSGEHPPFHGWIATAAEQPCGFMTVTVDYSTWSAERFAYMDCLYLRQPYRGIGLGRIFIDSSRQFAIAHRCGWAEWQTPVDNDLGIGFYRHLGVTAKAKLRFTYDVDHGGPVVTAHVRAVDGAAGTVPPWSLDPADRAVPGAGARRHRPGRGEQLARPPGGPRRARRPHVRRAGAAGRRARGLAGRAGRRRRGDRVAILAEKCAIMPVLAIGIWKAGAVYVPLDASQPVPRLRSLLDRLQPVS